MKTMHLILIRHGETEWNVQGRKQGHADSPLTARGVSNIRRLSQALVEELQGDSQDLSMTWRLVTSPAQRAVTTANLVGEALGIDCSEREPRLMEASHGDWEGLTNKEIDRQFKGQRKARLRDHWNYRINNGESYQDVYDRVRDWMQSICSDERLIIVTHAMTSRCVRGVYLQLSGRECLESQHHDHDMYFVLQENEALCRSIET